MSFGFFSVVTNIESWSKLSMEKKEIKIKTIFLIWWALREALSKTYKGLSITITQR